MLGSFFEESKDRIRYLQNLAAKLPHRVIEGEHGPYLTRYLLSGQEDRGRVYLHFFHIGDADRQLHNHPWSGTSLILTGGYREERRCDAILNGERCYRVHVANIYRPGDINVIHPDTFHRVDLLYPADGCWTLFSVSKRVQDWGFWDRDTGAFTQWEKALAARGLRIPTEEEREITTAVRSSHAPT